MFFFNNAVHMKHSKNSKVSRPFKKVSNWYTPCGHSFVSQVTTLKAYLSQEIIRGVGWLAGNFDWLENQTVWQPPPLGVERGLDKKKKELDAVAPSGGKKTLGMTAIQCMEETRVFE